jgi:hypothetical protein
MFIAMMEDIIKAELTKLRQRKRVELTIGRQVTAIDIAKTFKEKGRKGKKWGG